MLVIDKSGRKKALLLIFCIIAIGIGVYLTIKENKIISSKPFDLLSVNQATKIDFKVDVLSPYMIKIDFANTDEQNRNELSSLPLNLSLVLKNSNNTLVSETYIINGISGENRDKSVYREINTIMLDKGNYSLVVKSEKNDPDIDKFNPKITVLKVKK